MKERLDRKESTSILVNFLFFFILSISNIVFVCLCLYTSKRAFIVKYRFYLSIACSIFIITAYLIFMHFVKTKKAALIRLFSLGCILLQLILIFIFIGQKTGFFQLLSSPERLQAFLEKAGVWMPTIYILLQYLQVTVLPIPSVVSTLAGVTLFGAWRASIYSFIGIFLGSVTAFIIGRKLGKKAVAWLVGADSLKKWQTKLKGKDNFILTAMFFLPMFPDDILCFIAGLSSMTNLYFFIMIALARIISITACCFSFQLIPFNTWWGIALWMFIFTVIFAACILLYKNMDKINKKLKKIFKRKRKNNKKDHEL